MARTSKAPTNTIRAVKDLGIDYATLGNTHSMDYGKEGYLDTCRTLEENGIGYLGWGDDAASVKSYVKIKDGDRKIILYNPTERFENAPSEDHPGVNLYDEYRVCQEINELKERCDYLIVLYHGGIEGTHYNSEVMRTRFHRMADNGADVVISQHTHAIGEEEHYNGAYLLYGQGNFCFHFRPEVTPHLAEGLVLELIIGDDGFTAKPHRVLRTEKGCIYDEAIRSFPRFMSAVSSTTGCSAATGKQRKNLSGSSARTAPNGHAFILVLFRGANPLDAEKRKELSPGEFTEYLKRSYTREQLLGMQMFMRNEEFNEVGNRILSDLLDETEQTGDRYSRHRCRLSLL